MRDVRLHDTGIRVRVGVLPDEGAIRGGRDVFDGFDFQHGGDALLRIEFPGHKRDHKGGTEELLPVESKGG